jgi:hypothetical protein
MGMYTELVLKCETKEDIPKEIKSVLEFLFGNGESPLETPSHPFFMLPRWKAVGHCSSYYHHPKRVFNIVESPIWDSMYIFSRSDLKNYDGEIEAFIDWITPYLQTYGKTCIGWKWYEEDAEPTLIFVGE